MLRIFPVIAIQSSIKVNAQHAEDLFQCYFIKEMRYISLYSEIS